MIGHMRLKVWNPGFDVTPAKLITGIITEHGIIQQHDGVIDVNSFLQDHGLLEAEQPTENGRLSCTLLLSLPTCSLSHGAPAVSLLELCCKHMWACNGLLSRFSACSNLRVMRVRYVQQCADQQNPWLQGARHRVSEGLLGGATRPGRPCWPQRQQRCLDCAHSTLPSI